MDWIDAPSHLSGNHVLTRPSALAQLPALAQLSCVVAVLRRAGKPFL